MWFQRLGADFCVWFIIARYHVHEKIQNFMIPIDANGWHEEQVDELFASLLGRAFTAVPTEAAAPQIEAGALRIF